MQQFSISCYFDFDDQYNDFFFKNSYFNLSLDLKSVINNDTLLKEKLLNEFLKLDFFPTKWNDDLYDFFITIVLTEEEQFYLKLKYNDVFDNFVKEYKINEN